MSSTHTVLGNTEGHIESELPLDRAPHECLIKAVLGWTSEPNLPKADYEQIALQLTDAARSAAGDVRRATDQLPDDHQARALADLVLTEADSRLSLPLEGTVRCVQSRASLVRVLYERLDRLTEAAPSPARAQ